MLFLHYYLEFVVKITDYKNEIVYYCNPQLQNNREVVGFILTSVLSWESKYEYKQDRIS